MILCNTETVVDNLNSGTLSAVVETRIARKTSFQAAPGVPLNNGTREVELLCLACKDFAKIFDALFLRRVHWSEKQ